MNKALKKLKLQLEKSKSSLSKDQHKLEKIERAIQKAKQERNKSNEQKCKKYELKYRKKVSEHKASIEAIEKEIAKKKKEAAAAKPSGQVVLPQPQPQPQPLPQPQPQPVIKLPFPVLNDRRDKATIYRTLETKLNELMRKKGANIANMDGLERLLKTTNDRRAILSQLDKIKQLDANYSSQQDKLIKQLEYIKLSIQIGSLSTASFKSFKKYLTLYYTLDELRASAALTGGFQELPLMARLSQDLSEVVNYMKNENRMYLKSQKASLAGERDQSPPPSSVVPEKVQSPTKALTATYESVCKSLVAVLAHTAACAHATAAINAYTQSYYAYLQVCLSIYLTHII